MTTYTFFAADDSFDLAGGDLGKSELARMRAAANRSRPLREALGQIEEAARAVAKDAGVPVQGYRKAALTDDGRIAAAISAARVLMAPAAPTFTCAGGHGCRQAVTVRGGLCRQCRHDAD